MIRRSMFVGWYELLRNPRQLLAIVTRRRPSLDSEDFIMQTTPKHMSLTKPLESEGHAKPSTEPEGPMSDIELDEKDEVKEAV